MSLHSNAPSATIQAASSSFTKKFSLQHFSTFVAQEANIDIVPRFSLPKVHCMGGSYGPFTPNYPIMVPLWLALYFRQTQTCTLSPPAFLTVDFLEKLLARERETDQTFELLHFHFFEIAKLLLEYAAEDIPNSGEVMRLIPEIAARRREKIMRSIQGFQDQSQTLVVPGLRLSNLASMEIHFLRTSFCLILDTADDMEKRSNIMDSTAMAQSSVTPAGRPSDVTTVAATDISTSGARTEGRPSEIGVDVPLVGGENIDAEVVPVAPIITEPTLKKRRTLRQK